MTTSTILMPIFPSHALGSLQLGASLYEVLTIVKGDKTQYPLIDLHYSSTEPSTVPIIVSLPKNGLRLRFDGANQLLQLIEVLDFNRIRLSYKGSELVKGYSDSQTATAPAFRRIYQIFGASYPGEYLQTSRSSRVGTYVLSWTGVAFAFPLQHSAWSAEKDHVSILGSSAAGPATSMAIFNAGSWPDARKTLLASPSAGLRASSSPSRSKDSQSTEILYAQIHDSGRVAFVRRHPSPPFVIVLNQTVPQDLITALGAPDTTHKREHTAAAPQQAKQRRTSSMSRPLSNGRPHIGSPPSSYSSKGTDTFDTDFDSGDTEEDPSERTNRELFWCYFGHGVDILLGPPSELPASRSYGTSATPLSASPHLVVLKVIIHGNVPGSYAFNRHRRLRWELSLPGVSDLNSESSFEQLKNPLLRVFANVWPESEMSRGKVVNRTWGGSPSDSGFFLPDSGEDLVEGGGSEQWLGNTRLYTFPGFVFEVLENGAISALTVY